MESLRFRSHKLIYNISLRVCTRRVPFICYARSEGKADPKRNKFLKKNPRLMLAESQNRFPIRCWATFQITVSFSKGRLIEYFFLSAHR